MKTISATAARNHFGELLNEVQSQPVRVTRRGLVVGVLVSATDYEAARRFYADRLSKTMEESAASAARAGLTQEILDDLLSDES